MVTLLVIVLFVMVFGMMVMFVYSLFGLVGTFSFAPYVATGKRTAETMVRLSGVTTGMTCVELGSGNGEISLQAAARGATVIGFELNPILVLYARLRARHRGLAKQVRFKRANLWTTRLPRDTRVVFLYGLPRAMRRVWEKVEKECEPGVLIVSHAFTIPDTKPIKREGSVLVYRVE